MNSLKDKRFSLVIDRKISLEQLLELISFTSDVKLERSQGNIIYVKQKERRYDDLDIMKTQKGDSMYQILSPVTDY